MYIPAGLVQAIESEYPAFEALTPDHQRRVAAMLWFWIDVSYRHKQDQTAIALTKSVIRSIWNSDAVMRRVIGKNYFTVLAGNNLSRVANAFIPYDYMGRALLKHLLDEKPEVFIDLVGTKIRMPEKAFRSRAANDQGARLAKHSVWSDLDCAVA